MFFLKDFYTNIFDVMKVTSTVNKMYMTYHLPDVSPSRTNLDLLIGNPRAVCLLSISKARRCMTLGLKRMHHLAL